MQLKYVLLAQRWRIRHALATASGKPQSQQRAEMSAIISGQVRMPALWATLDPAPPKVPSNAILTPGRMLGGHWQPPRTATVGTAHVVHFHGLLV